MDRACRLSAEDGDLYFFRGRTDVRRCAHCGELLDKWEEDLSSVKIARRPNLDVSCSYDGVLVFSERARNAVEAARLNGLAFKALDAGLWWASATQVVEFDATKRRTRFEGACGTCGRFKSVTGATPVMLKPGVHIPEDGFVRTDLEFGTGDEKSPLVLCGAGVARVLDDPELRGLALVRL